jgi:hypothetical protein
MQYEFATVQSIQHFSVMNISNSEQIFLVSMVFTIEKFYCKKQHRVNERISYSMKTMLDILSQCNFSEINMVSRFYRSLECDILSLTRYDLLQVLASGQMSLSFQHGFIRSNVESCKSWLTKPKGNWRCWSNKRWFDKRRCDENRKDEHFPTRSMLNKTNNRYPIETKRLNTNYNSNV